MAWGGEIEILEAWLAEGRKVPDGYLDRPALRPTAEPVWEAFQVLSGDRSVGMGEGGIPFASIDRYALRYAISDLDAFDEFAALLHALDAEYLRIRAEQRERGTRERKKDRPV